MEYEGPTTKFDNMVRPQLSHISKEQEDAAADVMNAHDEVNRNIDTEDDKDMKDKVATLDLAKSEISSLMNSSMAFKVEVHVIKGICEMEWDKIEKQKVLEKWKECKLLENRWSVLHD